MRTHNQLLTSITLAALLFSGLAASGIAQDTTTRVSPETNNPVILTTNPADGEMNVDVNSDIEITFSSVMDETTINANNLQLHAAKKDSMHDMHQMHGDEMRNQKNDRSAQRDSDKDRHSDMNAVKGTISYSNNIAVFIPDNDLKEGTRYTFTIKSDVKSSANRAIEDEYTWSFTTAGMSDTTYSARQTDTYGTDRNRYDQNTEMDRNRYDQNAGMESNRYGARTSDTTMNDNANMIDLGKAGNYVILAKETIKNESGSSINGQTGEGTSADKMKKNREFTDSVRQRVPGQVMVWQSNKTDTTYTNVSEAIEDMMAAYSDISLQNGEESAWHNERFEDSVMTSGIYEWSESLNIASDVTLSGGADDVWIFKVGDNLTVDEDTRFILNGANAENIFWYVEGDVTIGKNAQFEGIILSMNDITLKEGAVLNGRMFSQATITLDDNTVTEPGTMTVHTSSTNR
jgi:hypothetical protein